MKHETLTEDQKKVIEQVGDELDSAFDAARDKLVAVGFDPDATGCTLCECGGFTGLDGSCDTRGCGHRIQRHLNLT
jgi:hypothetical protein